MFKIVIPAMHLSGSYPHIFHQRQIQFLPKGPSYLLHLFLILGECSLLKKNLLFETANLNAITYYTKLPKLCHDFNSGESELLGFIKKFGKIFILCVSFCIRRVQEPSRSGQQSSYNLVKLFITIYQPQQDWIRSENLLTFFKSKITSRAGI